MLSADPKEALSEIERLQDERAHRDRTGLHFVEGVRNFVQLIQERVPIHALVISDTLLRVPIARRLAAEARRYGAPTHAVSPEEFRRVSRGGRASGIGAVVAQRWTVLHRASPREGLCWVALERVRSPGNLGSLIRSAEAVGAAGFILTGGQIDVHDPVVVRASMGSFFRQKFLRTSPETLHHWIARHRCSVVGASPEGARDYHRYRFKRPTILVLGEERRGLSETQRSLCSDLVRIPMHGCADSLNLAVAGSLLLYEVLRTRIPGRGRTDAPPHR